MKKLVTVFGLFIFASPVFAQSSFDGEMRAMAQRLQDIRAAKTKVLGLPYGSKLLDQLNGICNEAALEQKVKAKNDILVLVDPAICADDMAIALAKSL